MFANVGESCPDKEEMAMGQKLCKLGNELVILMSGNQDNIDLAKKQLNIKFAEVYGDVMSAVGLLFKNDVGKNLKQLLEPLKFYVSLMPGFIHIQCILDKLERVKEIDSKEHKHRLERINKELVRIAVQETVIAGKLEDLGKSLRDIIKGEDSQKADNLAIFDITFKSTSSLLESCMSDLQKIKRNIDEGHSAIKEYMEQVSSRAVTGFFAELFQLIQQSFLAFVDCIKRKGTGRTLGGAADKEDLLKAADIDEIYLNYDFTWQTLDEKLTKSKQHLNDLRKDQKKYENTRFNISL